MNLIALPHTNEFVRIFNIGEPVRVSLEFHQELEKVDPPLRPIALKMRTCESHSEAAVELGKSRQYVQKWAAVIRGEVEIPEGSVDSGTRDLIAKQMKGLVKLGKTYREIGDILNEQGTRTAAGNLWNRKRVAAFYADVTGARKRNKERSK